MGRVKDLCASEVMVCGLEGEGQVPVLDDDGNQVLWAGTQLNDPNSNSDQEMRDRILQALASPSSPASESHGHGEELWQEQGQGEEEDDERGGAGGEVRFGKDARSRSSGREMRGGTVLRSSHPSQAGAGQHQRGQQVRDLDGVLPVRNQAVVHSRLRSTWVDEKGRTSVKRRRDSPSQGGSGEAQGHGQAEGCAHWAGRSRAELAEPADEDQGEEGQPGQAGGELGEAQHGEAEEREGSEPSPNVPPETREYIVFSSDPEDADHEATIVREKKIPVKKEPDQMSATPGRKARKAEETAEDLEYQERSE